MTETKKKPQKLEQCALYIVREPISKKTHASSSKFVRMMEGFCQDLEQQIALIKSL